MTSDVLGLFLTYLNQILADLAWPTYLPSKYEFGCMMKLLWWSTQGLCDRGTFYTYVLTFLHTIVYLVNESIVSFLLLPLLNSYVTIMCRNDELSWTMSWVGCLLTDLDLFILFAENSQILLKIFVIPVLLTFMYLVALNLLVNNQLNSSLNSTCHCGT